MKSMQTLMNLEDRVAMITGGAGHIGYAMAEALAELGCDLILVDINAQAAEAAAQKLQNATGRKVIAAPCDLEDETQVRALPEVATSAFGKLNILINNAAFVGTSGLEGWATPFAEQSAETWRRAIEVNLTSVFTLTQSCTDLLKASGNGAVINTSSIYGILGPDLSLYDDTAMQNPAAYAASKGGVLQFTRWCSTVLAPEVRVNAITPGGVARGQPQAFTDRYIQRTPLKRMAVEEDFKGATAYLASDMSRYVTGQNLIVDGGWSTW